MGRVTTAFLLTCAAIGVAGGIVLAVGWWLSVALFATVPFASVAIAGLWVMPAVIGAMTGSLPIRWGCSCTDRKWPTPWPVPWS